MITLNVRSSDCQVTCSWSCSAGKHVTVRCKLFIKVSKAEPLLICDIFPLAALLMFTLQVWLQIDSEMQLYCPLFQLLLWNIIRILIEFPHPGDRLLPVSDMCEYLYCEQTSWRAHSPFSVSLRESRSYMSRESLPLLGPHEFTWGRFRSTSFIHETHSSLTGSPLLCSNSSNISLILQKAEQTNERGISDANSIMAS